MKKTFDFGKVDFLGRGRKCNAVTVDMEYREKENGEKVLSISGSVWNTFHSDIIAGGQCLDSIARYIHNPTFTAIFRLWKLYHLNDMHPECIHQAAQGWNKEAGEKVTMYLFTMTPEAIHTKNQLERRIMTAARNGETWNTTPEEQLILSLQYSYKSETEELPASLSPFYKFKETEVKTRGWLKPEEHSRGLLGKPCPVCGYKYGHGWNYFPIPAEDEKIIYELLEGGQDDD